MSTSKKHGSATLSAEAMQWLSEHLRREDMRYRLALDALTCWFGAECDRLRKNFEATRGNAPLELRAREAVRGLRVALSQCQRRHVRLIDAARKRHPEIKLPRHRLPKLPPTLLTAPARRARGRPTKHTAEVQAWFIAEVDRYRADHQAQQRLPTADLRAPDTLSVDEAIRRSILAHDRAEPSAAELSRLRKLYYRFKRNRRR
jgi:hypothetical protein